MSDTQKTIYDIDGVVLPEIIDFVKGAIEINDGGLIRQQIKNLHEAEVADILHALKPDEQIRFAELSGTEFDFASLTELDTAIAKNIIDNLPTTQIAKAVCELDSDDAVSLLEDLPKEECEEILCNIPIAEQNTIRQALDYPIESAGRRMQTEFIAVPPAWNVGNVIDHIRSSKDLPQRFFDVFTIDKNFKLVGVLPLDILLRSPRHVLVQTIQEENSHAVLADSDQNDAADVLKKYDLLSAPVVDDENKLVGILTIDDVVDVLGDTADKDIKHLAGVGDEELSDSVLLTSRSRFAWLFVNLLTALIASWIIGLFQATIDQMVALAVLMPIVASMGGNAGTQTMTVAVRALAERELDNYNAQRIIGKELLIGIINGFAFAIIMAIIAVFWFGPYGLGLIIGLAIIVNMLFAASSGILIPLFLNRIGADPAISSGVFVTTVTDVVGFFAFLGLAALYLV